MSSTKPDELSRSENASITTKPNRPKMSLANQTFDIPTNVQTPESQPKSERSIEKIPIFIIWSIFNLIFVPFGILCCYFSYKVHQFKIQNRYEMATKWSKRTFVLNIMTTLLMIGVIITVYMLHYDSVQRNRALQANQTQTTQAYIPWQPGR